MRFHALTLLVLTSLTAPAPAADQIAPGEPVDYSRLAFYPDRWKAKGLDLELVPWKGKHVAFLTVADDLDRGTMTGLLGHLDAGWKLYSDLTGRQPRKHRAIDGLPTIAAVPGGGLTCGYGCGYVGATGIEMTHFYDGHYPALKKSPKAVPHAYYYEMGRNYFTFGRRHNAFTTGFAVFMRYVCVDTLELEDNDTRTRKTINEAITGYEQSDLSFLRAFTNADGLSEKQNRLKTAPTDQPVMYCSAMLKLWKTHGNEWLKKFYRQLATCPEAGSRTKDGAQQQCFHWYLAASCAAGKDLSPTFIKAWRFEPTTEQAAALKKVNWSSPSLDAGKIARSVR